MRVGVRYDPEWPPTRVLGFARSVEQLGYDEMWLSEDCFWAGGVAMAAAALSVTTRITVGVGLFAAAVRNPATAAMEISALAGIAPSRFTAAFGHGVRDWMEQIGGQSPAPLALLEETVTAVRRLLAGEVVTMSTQHVHLESVRLDSPPQVPPPVLVGTTGPKGLAVAGRSADGVVLPELSCPAAVRWARAKTKAAGRSGRTVVFAFLNLDSDASAAAAAVEPAIAHLARSGHFPRFAELAGISEDDDERLDAATVGAMAVVGDADDCANSLRRWEQSGVDTLVLFPRSDDCTSQVERFAAEVLPRMRQR
jgi:alkanesulfonate monooxygenase SsuD/methylene tetrahydromethanopterin reductase-like flavin-dependent oxidoreductase (luciferase family)